MSFLNSTDRVSVLIPFILCWAVKYIVISFARNFINWIQWPNTYTHTHAFMLIFVDWVDFSVLLLRVLYVAICDWEAEILRLILIIISKKDMGTSIGTTECNYHITKQLPAIMFVFHVYAVSTSYATHSSVFCAAVSIALTRAPFY